jgi:hypothetical protein
MNIKRFRSGSFGWAMLLVALLLIGAGEGFAQNGGGGGGTVVPGPTPAPTPAILPSTPLAPDVIMRESFGLADQARPAGGKGTAKFYSIHSTISGFWIEYPGSKDTAWLAPPEPGQTWHACGASDDPYEMFSPIQSTFGNGCLVSDWRDPISEFPTALMPFKAPATPYQISIDVWLGTNYLGFGLTGSSLLNSNLETSGSIWLELKPGPLESGGIFTETYELRVNGRTGPVLASGTTYFDPHSRLVIRYDPVTKLASASVNEVELGIFPLAIANPRFIGIEGVGIVDNFVVRKLP